MLYIHITAWGRRLFFHLTSFFVYKLHVTTRKNVFFLIEFDVIVISKIYNKNSHAIQETLAHRLYNRVPVDQQFEKILQ